jgi:hypothetical protein
MELRRGVRGVSEVWFEDDASGLVVAIVSFRSRYSVLEKDSA